MTDYEARLKIYNRLCNENDKEKCMSRVYLFGELKMTNDEFMGALNWLVKRSIVEIKDDGKNLRLGPTGVRHCEDRTEPELSD